MNNKKIKIIYDEAKSFDSITNNSRILLIILCLILYHSIKGNVQKITLERFYFVFDAVIKGYEKNKNDVVLSSPWNIIPSLRKLIIMANENGFISILEDHNKISLKLAEKGTELVELIIMDSLFEEVNNLILKLTSSSTNNIFGKQNLVW